MKNRIVNKVRSRTGASISFALLLFLVCAVLCSVILTAATTASGRMSNLAETDQRYYAVTSAAELMKGLINGQTVKIEKITTGIRTETYNNGLVSTSMDYDNVHYTLKINSTEVTEPNPSFASIVVDAAYKYFKGGGSRNLTLASSDALKSALGFSGDADSLKVIIDETVDSNGNISFTLERDGYKMEIVFSASVTGPTTTEVEGAITTTTTSATESTITTEMTKTETTTLTWTLTGIKVNPETEE